MKREVIVSPEAEEQLGQLYNWITEKSSPVTAARYTDAVLKTAQQLELLPFSGVARDDIRPGLRITTTADAPLLLSRCIPAPLRFSASSTAAGTTRPF